MADETQQEEKNQDGAEVKVPAKFKDFVETVSAMSVVDLAELVKVLEKKFGVSAAAPMAVAGVAAPAAAAAEEEASAVVNIELTEAGSNKIAVIKVVREITEKGLKDAKDMVDGAPQIVKEGVARAEAEVIKKKLEEAGGKVTFK
ncbi:MAG: 50S ribosomal protein L7/L12 [Patescibacteria group bacterium]|jgi:large subunit ribosomal protein L7/L12